MYFCRYFPGKIRTRVREAPGAVVVVAAADRYATCSGSGNRRKTEMLHASGKFCCRLSTMIKAGSSPGIAYYIRTKKRGFLFNCGLGTRPRRRTRVGFSNEGEQEREKERKRERPAYRSAATAGALLPPSLLIGGNDQLYPDGFSFSSLPIAQVTARNTNIAKANFVATVLVIRK